MAIVKTLTEEQKKTMVDLQNKKLTYKDAKLRAIRQAETEYHKKKIPFDRYSIIFDFQDALDNFKKEYERNVGSNPTEMNEILKQKDIFPESKFEEYSGGNAFEILDVDNVMSEKLLDGIRQTVQDQKKIVFRAKKRGNKVSIFMFNAEYDKLYGEKPKPVPPPPSTNPNK